MDEQFESEAMQDLAGETPPQAAEDIFEDDAADENGFEEGDIEEDTMAEESDDFEGSEQEYFEEDGLEEGFEEELGEEFAEEDFDIMEELEDVMADALDAEDSDEFLGRLIAGIGSIGRIAGGVGRAAGLAGRAARASARLDRAGRTAGRVARVVRGAGRVAGQVGRGARRTARLARAARRGLRDPGGGYSEFPQGLPEGGPGIEPEDATGTPGAGGMQAVLARLLPLLQRHAAQGSNETELFEDLGDWFEDEGVDEALPVLAGVAARAAVRPLVRRTGSVVSRAAGRQVVRSATQAARTLVRRQGAQAVRALPRIARSVGRAAARWNARPGAVASALRRTAARVAARPALVRRLAHPTAPASTRRLAASGVPRRIVVRGPVEIIVRR